MKTIFTKSDFEDNEGNLHYIDTRHQKEYIIPKEKRGTFKILTERYFVSLAIGLVLMGLKIPLYLCIAASFMTALLLSLFYSQKFMPQMQLIRVKKVQERIQDKTNSERKDKGIRIIIISFIIICFAILNNFYQNYQETNMQAAILSWIVAIVSFINILKQIYVLKIQKGGNR